MKYFALIFSIILFGLNQTQAQEKTQNTYKVISMGFYNFENLFDTLNDPILRDDDFTPKGKLNYTQKVYEEKLGNLAHVISQVGTDMTPDGLALFGVAEIENKTVLEDFAKQPKLKNRNYKVVHYNSADKRGVDVGLMYNPKYFKVLASGKIRPKLFYDPNRQKDTVYTRDMLWVKGTLDGDLVHVIVCHWPSRRGGSYLREGAASFCKMYTDSILKEDPSAKVFIMGDLNDDPISPSVKTVIGAKGKQKKVKEGDFFNPWMKPYKNGYGTLAYNDAWNLFDQILVSYGSLYSKEGYRYYKNEIFRKSFMISKGGRFKGYPFRTYSYGKYIGGYSDHLPVCIYLVKKQ